MEKEGAKKPPRTLKILFLAGGLFAVVAAGAVWLFLSAAPSVAEASFMGRIKNLWAGEKPSIVNQGHIYKMEPILVNLLDTGQLHYLKTTLHLESNQDKVNEEYEKRLPQLRDAILTILSSKNYKDIMSPEGKTALREEIKTRMNQLLVNLKVQNIYFTEFVVQ